MGFDDERTGTGTAEWAETNVNICRGCSNDCLYCYAAANAAYRFKTKARDDWHNEEFTKQAEMRSYPKKSGVVMFPSTHDITPGNLEQCIRVVKLLLAKGNKVLLVSKPRLECVIPLAEEIEAYRSKVLFRFTIGTLNEDVSRFWEPGASLPYERLQCLSWVWAKGFNTSVSIEPMLGGIEAAARVVHCVKHYVSHSIWLGKMNRARQRVDISKPENLAAVAALEQEQSDAEITALYLQLADNPLVRWKDSIRAVVGA